VITFTLVQINNSTQILKKSIKLSHFSLLPLSEPPSLKISGCAPTLRWEYGGRSGGVAQLKARFNNMFFNRNLNQNMPYIALFLKKISELSFPIPLYCHLLCNKIFKVFNFNVSTFILFKINTNRVTIANALSLILS